MKRILPALLAISLLTGCSSLLEREYRDVSPHSATYWESEAAGILRADEYQDLVNDLLLLVAAHTEDGTVRLHSTEAWDDPMSVVESACSEVQKETVMGSYAVEYITYSGKELRNYYELTFHIDYRRTAEQQQAIINVTSTDAIPDLLTAAIEQGLGELAVRVSYFSTDQAGVREMVAQVFAAKEEAAAANGTGTVPDGANAPLAPEGETVEAPWEVYFYPEDGTTGIVEIVWTAVEKTAAAKNNG